MKLMEPTLEFAFEARVGVGPEQHIGRSPEEVLGFTPITGGTVTGPSLNGTVVPGGGDWWVGRGETYQLDARYLLRADDGAVIDIVNRGYFRASPDVLERLIAQENVPEDQYYYRTAAVFQTDAPQHKWLAEHQFLGLARDEGGVIHIRFFVVR
jgi:hypothetical protein